MVDNYYKVGGSLNANHSTYVVREADEQIFRLLKAGEYCFVFNFRQVRSQFIRCSEEDRDRTFVRVANKKYKYILYFEQTGDDRAAGIVAFSHCDRPRD